LEDLPSDPLAPAQAGERARVRGRSVRRVAAEEALPHPHDPPRSLRRVLPVPAHRVREPHLPRRPALGLEQPRARDQDARAPRPRGRDGLETRPKCRRRKSPPILARSPDLPRMVRRLLDHGSIGAVHHRVVPLRREEGAVAASSRPSRPPGPPRTSFRPRFRNRPPKVRRTGRDWASAPSSDGWRPSPFGQNTNFVARGRPGAPSLNCSSPSDSLVTRSSTSRSSRYLADRPGSQERPVGER